MILTLTDDEKASLVKTQHSHKGCHYFSACPTCGYLSWQTTHLNEPEDVVVSIDPYLDCARCAEVASRAPEVVKWVVAVISFQERCRKSTGEQLCDTNSTRTAEQGMVRRA